MLRLEIDVDLIAHCGVFTRTDRARLSRCQSTLSASGSPVRRRCLPPPSSVGTPAASHHRQPGDPTPRFKDRVDLEQVQSIRAWFMTSRRSWSNFAVSSGVRASRICAGVVSTNGGRSCGDDPADAVVPRETKVADRDNPRRVPDSSLGRGLAVQRVVRIGESREVIWPYSWSSAAAPAGCGGTLVSASDWPPSAWRHSEAS